MLPTSLQRAIVAMENDVRRKVHVVNAESVMVEALSVTPRNVHSSKVAPEITASVRSTSRKRTRANLAPVRSRPYQSSSTTSVSSSSSRSSATVRPA